MAKPKRKGFTESTKNSFSQLAGIFGKSSEKQKPKKRSRNHSKNYLNINIGNIEEFLEPPQKSSIKKKKYVPNVIVDSFGESVIGDWLRKHNIKFIREKKFRDLKNPQTGQQLRFDFYLPDLKMCIEFDGKQHFQTVKKFDKDNKDNLAKRQFRDAIKDRFCIHRNFRMLRITYKQINTIERILCANCLQKPNQS